MSHKAKEKINGLHISRIQSSSSINTYRQCPRKYYYSYIEKKPTKPSIHLIRGKIAHTIVEEFFRIDIEKIPEESFEFYMKVYMQDKLSMLWTESKKELDQLKMSHRELDGYLEETKDMLQFWFLNFLEKLKQESKTLGFKDAFRKLTPKSEEHFISHEIGVQGFVDAIHEDENGITLIDYKTSKKNAITDDYKLQLAIYSLLYHEKYKRYPDKVGLFLFRHGELILDVDERLLEFARQEIVLIHECTCSTDISDYPKKESILCNWGRGQCDFYEICSQKTMKDF